MLSPLYTADEMRAAEQGHDVETMMERAGRAVADAVLRRYPDAKRIAAVCGKGANGGGGKNAPRGLTQAGPHVREGGGGGRVVVDAPLCTRLPGAPPRDAARPNPRPHNPG